MSSDDCTNHDPLKYEDCPAYVNPSDCEIDFQDSIYEEYILSFGFSVDLYLVTKYTEEPIFGEDALAGFGLPPIRTKAIYEPSSETLSYGAFEKSTENEYLILYLHKNSVRLSIRCALLDAGLISDHSTIDNPADKTKLERHRLDLQPKDVLVTLSNGIHYTIDGIKEAPEYVHMHHKYVYELHLRPRLVSAETLGHLQDVTDEEEIREQHNLEIQNSADTILF